MKTTYRIMLLLLSVYMTAVFLSACSGAGSIPVQTSTPSLESTPSAAATPASASASMSSSPAGSTAPAVSPTADAGGIVYQNTEYGFDFNLPKDWDGYTVIPEKWEGRSFTEEEIIVATGPIILIRNPKWTEAVPMQDIPIMVFTIDQWNAVQREEFAVSAAPVGPSELGRNAKYVFALPARYNFSYKTGFEEVEDIMNSNPLRAYDKSK